LGELHEGHFATACQTNVSVFRSLNPYFISPCCSHTHPPFFAHSDVVLENACGQVYTYKVLGEEVIYLGKGDLHDTDFEDMVATTDLLQFLGIENSVKRYHGVPLNDFCHYTLRVYPSKQMEQEYLSVRPWIFVILVVVIFLFTIGIIIYYDWQVDKRQVMVMMEVKKTSAIVSSIFPSAVRKRLYDGEDEKTKTRNPPMNPQKMLIKGFLTEHPTAEDQDAAGAEIKVNETKPSGITSSIADTFPHTTIMFADIVGFTAWSSEREPGQVFMLLQTLYNDFDILAKKCNVFKVETIGDCYVAATGLPEPQTDHAVRMARFATQCMMKMNELTRGLELTLGPDTGELRMRVGLHSGAVTAGVLKGAKARFQLFGDTMNMAARMMSNGSQSRIQCSEDTAKRMKETGKDHWLREREDKVQAKGKGLVQTYWIMPHRSGLSSVDSRSEVSGVDDDEDKVKGTNPALWTDAKVDTRGVFDLTVQQSSRQQRLVDWNIELLSTLLRKIVAGRKCATKPNRKSTVVPSLTLKQGSTALDEVTEIISLPQFDDQSQHTSRSNQGDTVLDEIVAAELKDYVTTIASMYRENGKSDGNMSRHAG
jgi:class 3 adenylate cyclase